MNKSLLIVVVLVTTIMVSAFNVVVYFHNQNVTGSTSAYVTFNWSPLQASTTKGGSVNINCAVFNNDSKQSVKTGFAIQLVSINNVSYWANESIWKTIFNQTFAPCILTVGPRAQQTTVLTINIAQDAPVGTYDFALQGNQRDLILTVTA